MNKFKIVLSLFVIFTLLLSVYSQSFVNAEIMKGSNERFDPLSFKGAHSRSTNENMVGTPNFQNNLQNNENIIYVDNNTGEGHYRDLRTAVNASKSGDIICIEHGFYRGNENSNITIDHNLTILGKNTNKIGIDVNNTKDERYTNNTYFSSNVVFDGEGKNSFFTINQDVNLNLLNLTFVNGYSQNSGGAIINKGILTIDYSSFSNNTVTQIMDGSNWYDDEDYGDTTTEDLENTSGIYKSCGGAIYSANQIMITNSNFDNNVARDYCKGGAIFNGGEKLDINNTLFKSNNGYDGGGAIYSSNGTLSIDYSTFEINTASTDTSSSGGGAIYAENTNIKINSSILGFNKASKSYGGAINYKESSLALNDNYFIGNIADGGDGGALYSFRNHETFINGSLFIMNNASADGGAIYHESGSYNIQNSALINNTANRGGASYFSGESNKIKVSGNAFLNNSVDNEGGAIYNSKSDVELLSNDILANKGKIGGAVYSDSGSLNISDSILRDNTASINGGALYSFKNNMNIKNDTFINNTAENNGGAFYLTGDSNSIGNSTFAINAALKNGGAIYSTETVNVHYSTFKANMAAENGGVLYSGKTPSLNSNVYKKNIAGKYGGVLFSEIDTPSERISSFSENVAGSEGNNYYTQKEQENNSQGIVIGLLVGFIFILIGLIVVSIISAGALTPTVEGWVAFFMIGGFGPLTFAQTICAGAIAGIIVAIPTFVIVFVTEYLFELCPEFKEFTEKHPLLIPIITIAIVLICFIFVLIESGALSTGLTILLQHIDDLITILVYGVKAGAGIVDDSNNKPPDSSKYQNGIETNNSNPFFKGISFNYNGRTINSTNYDASDLNRTSYNNNSGVLNFNFQATPKIQGYPMLYCKGSYNTMSYYATFDFFTSAVYNASSRVYTWGGEYSNFINS
jgi:predicted outer membrane repeat protein